MLKHSLSRENAMLKVQELKNKTSGTLENFIRRHGEVKGTELFESFCKKSSHTEKSFKEKYGENWEFHWESYLKSKSSGLNVLIAKYGENDGKKRFHDANEKRKNQLKKESLIEKFGIDGYDEISNKRKTGSLDFFIKKYGEDIGRIKYKECCEKKSKSSCLSYYIEKYGLEEGKQQYIKNVTKKSPIFAQLKKIYGEEKALDIYIKNKNKKEITKQYNLEFINLDKARKSKFFKKSRGCTSKESIKFFKVLEEKLKRNLIYGTKKDELKIFDNEKIRTYYYDCYDPLTNTLIEFHGIAFHPKEGDFKWISPYGRTYNEAYAYDKQKEKCAIISGFKYIKIYSDDVKLKHDGDKKIKELQKKLNI